MGWIDDPVTLLHPGRLGAAWAPERADSRLWEGHHIPWLRPEEDRHPKGRPEPPTPTPTPDKVPGTRGCPCSPVPGADSAAFLAGTLALPARPGLGGGLRRRLCKQCSPSWALHSWACCGHSLPPPPLPPPRQSEGAVTIRSICMLLRALCLRWPCWAGSLPLA